MRPYVFIFFDQNCDRLPPFDLCVSERQVKSRSLRKSGKIPVPEKRLQKRSYKATVGFTSSSRYYAKQRINRDLT